MKNALKSRSLFVFCTQNVKKDILFFNFDPPVWKPEKSAPFSHKKRNILGFVFDIKWTNFLE